MTQQLTQNLFQYWKVPRSKCKWKICFNREYFIMLYLCMPLTLALQIVNTMNVSDRKTLSSIFERNEINGETEGRKKIFLSAHTITHKFYMTERKYFVPSWKAGFRKNVLLWNRLNLFMEMKRCLWRYQNFLI